MSSGNERQSDLPKLRLAELIAALSLATDLGMGQPMEHALRTCLLSIRLGKELGVSEQVLAEVYYVALLRRIGCTSDSHELGALFGDDLAAHTRVFILDFARPVEVLEDMLRYAGAGTPLWRRIRLLARALAAGPDVPRTLFRASCEVAQRFAEQLGFSAAIGQALGQTFERWDGRGLPNNSTGEEIRLSARIVHVAEDAEVFHRMAGVDSAIAVIRKRSGSRHDPSVAEHFVREAHRLLDALDAGSAWEAVLAEEPGAWRLVSEEQLDVVLRAMAAFADLKSPYLTGHSLGVSALAATAAEQSKLPTADVVDVRRAALVHDLGRVGVPSGIWEKAGPLTESEWERVRLHAYYTERVLARPKALHRLGALAGLHHERLDGSGYHRAVPSIMLPMPARILAAADAYHAMTEARPHRVALAPEVAATELQRRAGAGQLDGDAVVAVLNAAGHVERRRVTRPTTLSPREVEVVRLVARGLSKREIADRLVISPSTVDHHIRHIYTKIGVSTRAGATLFAMQHGLLDQFAEE
jgi:HD-GYP domain-containing protein (c-di-GMP phosphodiesterase class II)